MLCASHPPLVILRRCRRVDGGMREQGCSARAAARRLLIGSRPSLPTLSTLDLPLYLRCWQEWPVSAPRQPSPPCAPLLPAPAGGPGQPGRAVRHPAPRQLRRRTRQRGAAAVPGPPPAPHCCPAGARAAARAGGHLGQRPASRLCAPRQGRACSVEAVLGALGWANATIQLGASAPPAPRPPPPPDEPAGEPPPAAGAAPVPDNPARAAQPAAVQQRPHLLGRHPAALAPHLCCPAHCPLLHALSEHVDRWGGRMQASTAHLRLRPRAPPGPAVAILELPQAQQTALVRESRDVARSALAARRAAAASVEMGDELGQVGEVASPAPPFMGTLLPVLASPTCLPAPCCFVCITPEPHGGGAWRSVIPRHGLIVCALQQQHHDVLQHIRRQVQQCGAAAAGRGPGLLQFRPGCCLWRPASCEGGRQRRECSGRRQAAGAAVAGGCSTAAGMPAHRAAARQWQRWSGPQLPKGRTQAGCSSAHLADERLRQQVHA